LLVGNAGLMIFSGSMAATDFPLSRYLERIGLASPPAPDEEGLRRTHSAQVFSIPFENIDIHLARPISLKPEDLIAKVLERKRGGYCFELNGIFLMALKILGFTARPHMARVLYGRKDPGPRTHEVVAVTISGREWLADTGFGGPGLREPIPMIPDRICEQYGERYRLRRDPGLGMVLQKETQNSFLDLYSFNENELTIELDIEIGNYYTSTSPASIFRSQKMCFLPQPGGRTTLTDMELTIHRGGQSISRTLPPGPEYIAALASYFGIDVDAKYEDLAPMGN
jgi:N-hydroxyarylamine O-acetyltransferase